MVEMFLLFIAILFLFMAVLPLFTGKAYIRFSTFSKDTQPNAYWGVIIIFFILFLWSLFAYFGML